MTPTIVYLSTRSLELERIAELEACKRVGVRLVLVSPPGGARPSPVEQTLVHQVIEPSTLEPGPACEEIVARLQQGGLEVDGVVAWTDSFVELAARLCEALGCRGTAVRNVDAVRNKACTRRRLVRVQGANPRFSIIADEGGLSAALEEVGVPCLLKPAGASGGRGIHRIADASRGLETYREFAAYCDPARDAVFGNYAGQAVLEQELQGSEHSVAGIVHNGVVHPLAIADKHRDHELRITHCTVVPSTLPDAKQAEVLDLVLRVIPELGIDNCGFHVDLMVTPEGPRILEVGGRLGGDCINSHLIPLACDVDPYQALLAVASGQDPGLSSHQRLRPAHRQAAMSVLLPPHAGRLAALEGIASIRRHPQVVAVAQVRAPGDLIVPPWEAYGRYALAYVVATGSASESMSNTMMQIGAGAQCVVEPATSSVA